MRTIHALCCCALVLAAGAAGADPGTLKGYMYGDYYYVVSADDGEANYPEKQNAFRYRRIYLTYNRDLSDDFSMRYRLEANDGGYGKGDKMNPFVKHAYLRWRGAMVGSDVYLGLAGTPTWGVSERVWGYRSIEATIMDVRKYGSSADLGVALKGKAGSLAYHFMVGNGPGQKPEEDNGKKLYASVDFVGIEGIHLEGYVDYSMRPADQNKMTLKGFLGLEREGFRAGVEPFIRIHQEATPGEDQTLTGVSVFGALDLSSSLAGFGRVDMINDDVGDTTDLLLIAGLDHSPAKDIHLMPNLYVNIPDGPDPSIQARLTMFYKF
ncbi:hypothetical protein ACFL6X_08315 [Candidatus Latescibacterota bacterium]